MQIVKSHFILEDPLDGLALLRKIERIGRTCYRSEGKITKGSYRPFIKKIIKLGHLSVLEHVNVTVRFICDRSLSHQLVRHRLASYSQESQRYCNYQHDRFEKQLTFIDPLWEELRTDSDIELTARRFNVWCNTMEILENSYFKLIELGLTPQEARSVLPNATRTEIVSTMNLRQWMHVLDIRCHPTAQPQMRALMKPLLAALYREIPIVFDAIYQKHFALEITNGDLSG